MRKIVIFLLFACAAACSSTIGNKVDPAKALFHTGVTTKSQVAETLGLPAAVDYSSDRAQEIWIYQKSPHLQKVQFVTPSGISNPNPFYDVTLSFKDRELPENIGIVYVFDKAGFLVDVQKP